MSVALLRYVIDTSVALKWYIPEPGSAEALLYLGSHIDRHAPDLLPLEATHALPKRSRGVTPDLTRDAARRISVVLRDHAPIQYHESGPLLELALDLAYQIGASSYDGLFLALAIILDGRVVTADAKFRDKVIASPHSPRIRWYLDSP